MPSLLKAIFQTLSLIGSSEGKKLLNSVRLWVCSGETLSYELLTGMKTSYKRTILGVNRN